MRMALSFGLGKKTIGGAERFFGGGKIKYLVKCEMLLDIQGGMGWALDVLVLVCRTELQPELETEECLEE